MVIIDQLLRSLFGALDSLLGWAVSTLYSLIVQIANVDIFGDYIWEFAGRIYTFLAIFMLFKLSVSMVNYILNPDQFSDKSKGFGKLIQNVIIVIVLIITVPNIFEWAYDLQSMILNSNVLYTVVTGRKNNSNFELDEWNALPKEEKVEKIKNSATNAGNQIKYEIMSTFIYYKDDCTNSEDCSPKNSEYNTTCHQRGVDEAENGEFSYTAAYDCLVSGDTVNNKSEKNYGLIKDGFTNEYKFLISTICMIAVAYVFLVFAFDVALRSVKLGVLQLIAPIPIMSRLDPNSGKSGMFSKWLKECSKTYLDLFIRLLGLFFAIEIITSMTVGGKFVWRGTGVSIGFGFVKIFIILGLLMFAKQLPQFIEGITGYKLDSGGLNLKKKLGGIPLAGKPILAGAGLAGRTGMALGAMGGRYAGKIAGFTGKKVGQGIGWADNHWLGGIGHKGVGAVRGIGTAIGGFKSGVANTPFGKWVDSQSLDARRTFSEIGSDATKTFYGVTGGIFGGSSAADRMDDKVKRLDGYKKFKDQLTAQADFDDTNLSAYISGPGADKGVKGLKKYYEDLKNSGTATVAEITDARKNWEDAQDLLINGTVTGISSASIQNIKSQAARYVRENRDVFAGAAYSAIANDNATIQDIKGGIGQANADSIAITSSEEYQKAQAKKAAMPKK